MTVDRAPNEGADTGYGVSKRASAGCDSLSGAVMSNDLRMPVPAYSLEKMVMIQKTSCS